MQLTSVKLQRKLDNMPFYMHCRNLVTAMYVDMQASNHSPNLAPNFETTNYFRCKPRLLCILFFAFLSTLRSDRI